MRPDLDAVDKVSQRFLSVPFFMLPPPVPPRAHFDINIHTHTHTHVYDLPPAMTATRAPAPDTSSPPTELESLTALVDRLSVASMEAMRLAIEVKARLPAVVAAEVSARANAPAPESWIRGVPRTPDDLDAAHPEGSGEVCAEADRLCDRVPRGFKQVKRSRREALAWYREQYFLLDGKGVQKWVEA
ncbi:hypothetical protein B0H14DRAFT_2564078 [Mycena olivaceomarginata]|nr:hypothetical protein B0H14DRAFT_2564078 [Mycena olivaceomarginata]